MLGQEGILIGLESIGSTSWAGPAIAGVIGLTIGLVSRRRKQRPNSLGSLALTLNAYPTPNELLKASLDTVARQSGAVGGTIHLVNREGADALDLVCSWGKSPLGDPEFSRQTLKTQQPIHLSKAASHASVVTESGPDVGAVICVPLIATQYTPEGNDQTQAVGVLTIWSSGKQPAFPSGSLDLALGVANIVALAVTKLVAQDYAVRTSLSALSEIAELLDAKTPETDGHSRRVSILGGLIARQLGLPDRTVTEIEDSARLLDIGKVAIPEAILKKQTALTDEEFAQVQQHPLVSYEICRKLRLPESTLLLVRNHHERIDGTGYPDRLKGGEISIALRVVAAADAYVAMRSVRSHRGPLTGQEALEILTREAGSKFDVDVVEAIAALDDQGRFQELYPEPAFCDPENEVRAA